MSGSPGILRRWHDEKDSWWVSAFGRLVHPSTAGCFAVWAVVMTFGVHRISESHVKDLARKHRIPQECSAHALQDWISHPNPWKGYHVICGVRRAASAHVWVYRGGLADDIVEFFVEYNSTLHPSLEHTSSLHAALEIQLGLSGMRVNESQLRSSSDGQRPSWQLFDTSGNVCSSEFLGIGVALLYEGGTFLWPGIREGFRRSVGRSGDSEIILETLELSPLVFRVRGAFKEDEAGHLMVRAIPEFAAQVEAGTPPKEGGYHGVMVGSRGDKVVQDLIKKIVDGSAKPRRGCRANTGVAVRGR